MPEPNDIFDSKHYAKVRLPAMEAHHLPSWCYTSRKFYEREVRNIFMKTWNLIGRSDHIPDAGDYLAVDYVGVPVIVVRDRDGELRAFSNSCRHRGARLLSSEGNCRKHIKCPYHSWTYALDGTLVGAPGMERTMDFNKSQFGLRPIKLATWEGFLFISFDHNSESLRDYLGDLPERLACYNYSEIVCTRRKYYELRCNWKLYVENAMEEYHTSTVHRKSIGSQRTNIEPTRGQWMTEHLKSDKTIGLLPGETTTFPHIETLTGNMKKGTYFVLIYPCAILVCVQDCLLYLLSNPQGPQRTYLTVGWCFPKTTIARPDFEEVVERYYRRWDTSGPEDNWICEQQQLGLSSPFCEQSRVGRFETQVHMIDNWILDRVLADSTPT